MSRQSAIILISLLICAMLLATVGCDDDPLIRPQDALTATGLISIQATPDSLGLEWVLSGPEDFRLDGSGDAVLDSLAIGLYSLSWTGRAGWNRPDPAIVSESLAADDTLVFDGVYSERDFTPASVAVSVGLAVIGSRDREAERGSDELLHRTTLTYNFRIRDTEITQAEYLALIDTNPSFFDDCPDCPVEHLSWWDALNFCNALSLADGLDPAYSIDDSTGALGWDDKANGWRLPTEAEWEFACRAGDLSPFNRGDCLDAATEANYNGDHPYDDCAPGLNRGHTLEVGRLAPNNWDLYDMHGNVWEWCWDYYAADYYEEGQIDPTGPRWSYSVVARGGSWQNHGRHCRSAYRGNFSPDSPEGFYGLRPVRTVE